MKSCSRKEQSGAKSQPELHVHFAPAPHVPCPLQWLGQAALTRSATHACRTKAVRNATFSPALAMSPTVEPWSTEEVKVSVTAAHTFETYDSLRVMMGAISQL